MPSLNESTYWLTSVVEYQFPLSCSILLFASIRYFGKGMFATLFIAPAATFIAGEHEFLAVALLSIIGAVCIFKRLHNHADVRRWYVFLALTLIGLGLNMLAPGTRLRALSEEHKLHGLALARILIQQLIASFPRWISYSGLLLGGGLWIQRTSLTPGWLREPFCRRTIPLLTAMLSLMAVVARPVFDGSQAERALNLGFCFFAIGLLLSISANGDFLRREVASVRVLEFVAITALICGLNFSSNLELTRRGILTPLASWRQTMIRRIQLHGEDVVLPAVDLPTPLLSHSGVLDDKNNWLNLCVARYLHVGSILPEKVVQLKGQAE